MIGAARGEIAAAHNLIRVIDSPSCAEISSQRANVVQTVTRTLADLQRRKGYLSLILSAPKDADADAQADVGVAATMFASDFAH